jgi:hypothetical protein
MYFSLTNSLATFQMMIDKIFQDLITEGIVSVYLNDILILTNSLEEHCQITCLVLDCMYKPEKCEFEKTRIEYLSVMIPHNKVEMDRMKIAGVADWLTPSNKRRCNPLLALSTFTNNSSPGSLTMCMHSLT